MERIIYENLLRLRLKDLRAAIQMSKQQTEPYFCGFALRCGSWAADIFCQIDGRRIIFGWLTPTGEKRQRAFELVGVRGGIPDSRQLLLEPKDDFFRCRTLYFDGWQIYGRAELCDRLIYQQQTESHNQRAATTYAKNDRRTSDTKGRKFTYLGKPTRFAKKVQRAEDRKRSAMSSILARF